MVVIEETVTACLDQRGEYEPLVFVESFAGGFGGEAVGLRVGGAVTARAELHHAGVDHGGREPHRSAGSELDEPAAVAWPGLDPSAFGRLFLQAEHHGHL